MQLKKITSSVVLLLPIMLCDCDKDKTSPKKFTILQKVYKSLNAYFFKLYK